MTTMRLQVSPVLLLVIFLASATPAFCKEVCDTDKYGYVTCYDEGLLVGVIIAIIVGVLLFIVGAIILTCFCCGICCFAGRRRENKGQVIAGPAPQYQHQQYPTGVTVVGTTSYPSAGQVQTDWPPHPQPVVPSVPAQTQAL